MTTWVAISRTASTTMRGAIACCRLAGRAKRSRRRRRASGFSPCWGREPRFTHVPVVLLDVIVTCLATIGRWVPALAAKAELARIGRYYATESMLVLDPSTGRYDAQATPSTGSETLYD